MQCPMKFKLKYIDGNYVQSDAIHLDLGNILHKVLEIKYQKMIDNEKIDYEELISICETGISDGSEKDGDKFVIGLNSIVNKFGKSSFSEINKKSNLSYDDKLKTFYHYLQNDSLGEGWKPFKVEFKFDFVYQNKVRLHGFIDRIDINENGDFRVVDYKSSNKVFDKKDLTTPLQMFVYALACEDVFGKIPIEYQYDMIMLGEKQQACTKGYYNRGTKKLNKILDDIFTYTETGGWKPKPTPLCHWCDFSDTNPNASFVTQDLCDYYCLWTPDSKTFKTNREFIVGGDDDLEF